jgi:TolB-like protein
MPMIHVFGPFRLDGEAEVLTRGGEPLPLGKRAVALLRAMVDRSGHPIAKDTLIRTAWPGLAVDESNLHAQIAALRRALAEEPGGDNWIETLPRRGYRFIGPAVTRHDEPPAAARPVIAPRAPRQPAAPDRPSLAVLPFLNLSGGTGQDYFADGMVEEIIVGLSRSRALSVVSRGSSFAYKDRTVDVTQVGRELGVRYVMEGSVRRAANEVRITGRLVDAASGAHLWAERFHGTLEDIFDLQDQVTARVVGAITSNLERAEIERAKRKPATSLDAYDYYLRGMARFYEGLSDNTVMDEALTLFRRAITVDPEFGIAYSMAAFCYSFRKANRWMEDQRRETAEAAPLARRGAELGHDDAVALALSGHMLAYVAGDLDLGLTLTDRAVILNPNLSTTWWASAWVRLYCGDLDKAIEHFEHAMRLSPLDPHLNTMQGGIAFAHMLAGRYADALAWAGRAAAALSSFVPAVRTAAASNALAGRMEEARAAMARLRALDPDMRVANVKCHVPLRRPEHLARLQEGLRLAGLPEA